MFSHSEITKRIEENTDFFVLITEHFQWFEVEVFNQNGLVWRKRSFEPDYAIDLQHFINTYC